VGAKGIEEEEEEEEEDMQCSKFQPLVCCVVEAIKKLTPAIKVKLSLCLIN
jgi:hypothetical protein